MDFVTDENDEYGYSLHSMKDGTDLPAHAFDGCINHSVTLMSDSDTAT